MNTENVNVIKELYWGRIVPYEKDIPDDSPAGLAQKAMHDAECDLLDKLSGEDNELLNRLIELFGEYSDKAMEEKYVEGFRTGAQFMLAIFDGDAKIAG